LGIVALRRYGRDELRGGMDASQYKDYGLILLFVKYTSDKRSLRSKFVGRAVSRNANRTPARMPIAIRYLADSSTMTLLPVHRWRTAARLTPCIASSAERLNVQFIFARLLSAVK